MKGPKDSKESHTSVTMEGTGDTGRGMQGGGRILLCARVNYRALFVPGAGGEGRRGGHRRLFGMRGACGSPPAPAQRSSPCGAAGALPQPG